MPRQSMNGHRVHVILTTPQYRTMKRMSKKTGLTMAELIRRAVDSYASKEVK